MLTHRESTFCATSIFPDEGPKNYPSAWDSQFQGLGLTVPRLGTRSSRAWDSQFHGVGLAVPELGTRSSTAWYSWFHGVGITVPSRGNPKRIKFSRIGKAEGIQKSPATSVIVGQKKGSIHNGWRRGCTGSVFPDFLEVDVFALVGGKNLAARTVAVATAIGSAAVAVVVGLFFRFMGGSRLRLRTRLSVGTGRAAKECLHDAQEGGTEEYYKEQ